ncbi:MAG: adenylate/guanylate cyclase domain-containing protein [Mycobacterium sp.]
MSTVEPPTNLFILRLMVIPYTRGGIRLLRRELLFFYTVFSLLLAVVGPQLIRLFTPGLTRSEVLILTAIALAIYLIDDLLAYQAIAPKLQALQEWSNDTDRCDGAEMWRTAAEVPLAPVLRPVALTLVAALNLSWIAVLMRLQHLPAAALLLFIPGAMLFRFYGLMLRSLVTEQLMRPVLADISTYVKDFNQPVRVPISLAYRMFATIPMIAVIAGTLVAGVVGPHTIPSLAIGIGLSIAISISITGPLLLLATRSVTEPVRDLIRAADRVGEGDLAVQIPVTSSDEIGSLAVSFNSMIDGLQERERIRAAFGTYVDPTIVDHILASADDQLTEGVEVEITALFMDVRGFTGYSEQRSAREVIAMLNRLFATVVPIIAAHGGHVDKFIGDGLLAVFGVPQRCTDHADRALAAALDIAAALHNRCDDPDVGIGLNSGPVVAGNLGGAGRFDFTVIGDPVNVAARVESATRQTGDTILLSANTHALLSPSTRACTVARPSVPLKGKTQTIGLYAPADR